MLQPSPTDEAVFDALGNAIRRQILRLLGEQPRSVAELAAAFPVSRPAISRHLALLEDAGLIVHRPHGTRNVYSLDRRGFVASAAWLDRFWDEAEARLRLVAENLPDEGGGGD